jgi:subtilisin family serine protease
MPSILEGRIDAERKVDIDGRLRSEMAFQPQLVGEAGGGLAIVESLERDGFLLDVQPLARPPEGESKYSGVAPLGHGQTVAVMAESFTLRAGRPSDTILSGSMLLTFVDRQAALAAINRLSDARGVVERVEAVPARRLISSEPGLDVGAWHLSRIRADQARLLQGYNDGSAVTVALLDTGIDAAHLMLSPSISRYTSTFPGGAASSVRDLLGHGTHVAGILGARGAIDGVGRSRLRVLKVFGDAVDGYQPLRRPDGSWHFTARSAPDEAMYVAALAVCLDEDVPVINFSLGYDAVHSKEVELFAGFARNGQAVVAATGNGGAGAPPLYPACYEGVIAFGALDRDDRAAAFSSSAPYMLLSAPGMDILGTMPTYDGAVDFAGHVNEENVLVRDQAIPWTKITGTMSGTSEATPQVSAAAALWIARHGRDLDRLRDALESSARKLPEMNGARRTDSHGAGCLDLHALLS